MGDTGQTFDARVFIYGSRLFLFPCDGLCGAFSETDAAFGAFVLIHFKPNKGWTAFCRTIFVMDMGQIFITEISQGRQHGVRAGLAQAAQGGILDGAA